ncbi:MAG: hypothetical protein ABEJ06_06320 [Haloarculaceae archaeon]
MEQRGVVGSVIESQRTNAVLSWVLVVFVVGVAVASFLEADLLWTGFALVVAALAVYPAVRLGSLYAMLPWEVLVLAALPLLGRVVATVPLTGALATYLSVAALALVLAVELHVFTPVRMNHTFAIVFVVVATMATAGIWAVVRWLSDIYLGTALLVGPGQTPGAAEQALMWEFVFSTVAGVLGGVVFELYFRRLARATERVPREVLP